MDITTLTEKDIDRRVVYTHVIKEKTDGKKVEKLIAEKGRLMNWDTERIYVRLDLSNLSKEEIGPWFIRHGGMDSFTGCPIKPEQLEFIGE
jgi:hypothetical protein